MMTVDSKPRLSVAIACGGTGGHFFPGVAVAECLASRGCDAVLFVSSKAVDQQALKTVPEFRSVTLPAAAFTKRSFLSASTGLARSYLLAREALLADGCRAVLAMGGFTSAPVALAAKQIRAKVFLHESNAIPGRANKWLARFSAACFTGFPQCADHLRCRSISVTGTPVRSAIAPGDARNAKVELGLDAQLPVLLVIGGSQGAGVLNEKAPLAAGSLQKKGIPFQVLHITGSPDLEKTARAYANAGVRAKVTAFVDRMDLALRAVSVALSRAGASTLAEFAAAQVPAILVPFPSAAGNHQYYNALAMAESEAAMLIPQSQASPELLSERLGPLLTDVAKRQHMAEQMARHHRPNCADVIAQEILVRSGMSAAPGGSYANPAGSRVERCVTA